MKSSNTVFLFLSLHLLVGTATPFLANGYFVDNGAPMSVGADDAVAEAYSTSAYRMKLMHECLNHADYDETDVVVPLPVIGRVRISLKSPSPLEIV